MYISYKVYENSLCYILNFSVHLKLKKNSLRNTDATNIKVDGTTGIIMF